MKYPRSTWRAGVCYPGTLTSSSSSTAFRSETEILAQVQSGLEDKAITHLKGAVLISVLNFCGSHSEIASAYSAISTMASKPSLHTSTLGDHAVSLSGAEQQTQRVDTEEPLLESKSASSLHMISKGRTVPSRSALKAEHALTV